MIVGLVSDTHGLLRPAVLSYLSGVDHIIHAGDIGNATILDALAAIAPLTVVRGNNDLGDWASALPDTAQITMGSARLHVIHDIADLAPTIDVDVVICGHSHQPRIEPGDRHLLINPGSAGPRRFRLPIAAGRLSITDGRLTPEIQHFEAD